MNEKPHLVKTVSGNWACGIRRPLTENDLPWSLPLRDAFLHSTPQGAYRGWLMNQPVNLAALLGYAK
jgi:hypothetical protein